ncbi:hypothetical protein GF312_09415 [Candidatus Poribacteria bacterium]|nr:hypothetical protein [Candidatus Poribacteria bacterium]
MLFWVNIDKPDRKCTIHRNCAWVDKIKETPFKGIGEIKRDGGWRSFETETDSENYCKDFFGNYRIIKHCIEISNRITEVTREKTNAEQDDKYLIEVKNELNDCWDSLDNGTQEMLSIARYLHKDFPQKAVMEVYRLAVFQYCGCLENELLAKIYRALGSERKTFGGMIECLRILSKGDRDLRNQESEYIRLREFLEGHFDTDKLFSERFLDKLKSIAYYRNRAAHMKPLKPEDADECRKIVMCELRAFMSFAVAPLR